MAERPNACGSCNTRLNRRHWYYRHGGYFCKKACWKTADQKAKTEQQAKKEQAVQEAAKAEAPKEEAKPASA